MTFKAATDRLAGRVTHEDLARELGVSLQLIRQARLDASHSNHRNPPKGWEEAVVKLARRHSGDLAGLADELEGEG